MVEDDVRWAWMEFIEANREALEKEVADYDENPTGMRNLCAELGVEMTPQEIFELVKTVRESL